jgi:ankyrin repeat protein
MQAKEVLQHYMDRGYLEFDGLTLTDVNQPGHFGNAPLHIASSRGNLEHVEALINGGANVNAKGEDGDTPLFRAAEQGHVAVVKRLLEAGALPDLPNDFGRTARLVSESLERRDVTVAIEQWEKKKQ